MPKLPTQDDLKKLSQRAVVAYAARCARRVQPLFRSDEPSHIAAIDAAIQAAEAFARGEEMTPVHMAVDASKATNATGFTAAAAAHAFEAALITRRVDVSSEAIYHEAAKAADASGDAAHDAADRRAWSARDDANSAAFGDYQKLLASAKSTHSEHGDPVDVKNLGPLWPDGQPLAWEDAFRGSGELDLKPAEASGTGTVTPPEPIGAIEPEPFEFLIDPGTATKEEIAEIYAALSKLHRLMGGSGLQFTMTDFRSPVMQEDMS